MLIAPRHNVGTVNARVRVPISHCCSNPRFSPFFFCFPVRINENEDRIQLFGVKSLKKSWFRSWKLEEKKEKERYPYNEAEGKVSKRWIHQFRKRAIIHILYWKGSIL